MAPRWHVVSSRNTKFDAALVDEEVAAYEREAPGWKMALNTTEFLVGDLSVLPILRNDGVGVRSLTMVDVLPQSPPSPSRHLVEQKPWGIDVETWEQYSRSSPQGSRMPRLREVQARFSRLLKTASIEDPASLDWYVCPAFRNRLIHRTSHAGYSVGRHSWALRDTQVDVPLQVLHYSMSPWTPAFSERKTQIQSRIPRANRVKGQGMQHFFSAEAWNDCRKYWAPIAQRSPVPESFRKLHS